MCGQRWEPWKADSLLAANPGSTDCDGVPGLQEGGAWVLVARTCPTLQLRWQQFKKCGGETGRGAVHCVHFKFCTPGAVKKPRDLLCPLCAHPRTFSKAGRQMPQQLHLEFMRDLDAPQQQEWLPLCSWASEVRLLPGRSTWPGRIDIMLLAAGVSVQVDGSGHTRGHLGWDGGTPQQQLDAECAAEHWRLVRPLVRLTEPDLGAKGCDLLRSVLAYVQSGKHTGPLIVMGWGYTSLPVLCGGREVPYPMALAAALGEGVATCCTEGHPSGLPDGVGLLTM